MKKILLFLPLFIGFAFSHSPIERVDYEDCDVMQQPSISDIQAGITEPYQTCITHRITAPVEHTHEEVEIEEIIEEPIVEPLQVKEPVETTQPTPIVEPTPVPTPIVQPTIIIQQVTPQLSQNLKNKVQSVKTLLDSMGYGSDLVVPMVSQLKGNLIVGSEKYLIAQYLISLY